MSCGPPVSGRVNAIKSQFESLNNLESLDINGGIKKSSKHNFQRAVTSLDLTKRSEKAKNLIQKWKKSDIPKPLSDSSINIKESRRISIVTEASRTKQAKFEDEKCEIKLSRHTSDPSKRSSIRRSPAFRVGEKPLKSSVLTKQLTSSNNNNNSSKEFQNEKFENFLLQKCATDIDKLKQPGLTDSLKFALRQPLPAGPPPKKPPRSFLITSSSEDGDISPIKEINPTELFEKNEINSICGGGGIELKQKINYLENNLFTKTNNLKSELPLTKSKTELVIQGSKFLDCLSCHKNISNIYDSVAVDERKPLMQCNLNKNLIKRLGNNTVKPSSAAEPIYMEPFGHLKSKLIGGCDIIHEEFRIENTKSTTNSEESNNEENFNENSICSCPENHNNPNDLHYLCTAIDDSIEDSEFTDKDSSLSFGKTYDEITILVDAAFQQNTRDKENTTMSNRIESYDDDNSLNDYSSNNCKNSLSAVRLSRTLTEKRKDYVRRVATMPEKRQNYGSLQKTFKSPIIKTFSLENDDNVADEAIITQEQLLLSAQQDKIKYCAKNNIEEIELVSLNDRIDNYKKLIEENSNLKTKPHKKSVKMRSKKFDNNFSNNINNDSDENTGNIDLKHFEDNICELTTTTNNPKLFQVCLLIGYNTSTQSAYLKSKFPPNEPIPDNIEQLIFPSNDLVKSGRENQEYCLILTDDSGFKVYGYCRRILPENSDICLPLCYCIITVTKALGFYQKLLKEIESRHGQSDTQQNYLLRNLQNSKLPEPGKYLHLKLPLTIRPKTFFSSHNKISPKRLSLEANPKWLKESSSHITTVSTSTNSEQNNTEEQKSSLRKSSSGQKSLVQEYEEKKQQQTTNNIDFGLINRSLIIRDPRFDEILIRRPNDLRLENTELSELLISLGSELLVNVFATLLLERKVILQSQNISLLSKSILGLQTILYPFQWQYTIVTILPQNLIEICQAPFPVLAGILNDIQFEIEDGIVVNLDKKKIIQICGDEQTILPDSLRESLQLSLQMVDLIDQGKMLSGVLISEAFLRFFVELFGDYRQKYFHKDEFIQLHKSQNIKFFLEWFVETSMFRNFCNDKYQNNNNNNKISDIDSFYNLFDARLMEKSENSTKTIQNIETIVKNSKIINKKGKSFTKRFKEFLNHN